MSKNQSHLHKAARSRRAPRRKTQKKKGGFAFGRLKGEIQILGDTVSPVTPLDDWEALKDSYGRDLG